MNLNDHNPESLPGERLPGPAGDTDRQLPSRSGATSGSTDQPGTSDPAKSNAQQPELTDDSVTVVRQAGKKTSAAAADATGKGPLPGSSEVASGSPTLETVGAGAQRAAASMDQSTQTHSPRDDEREDSEVTVVSRKPPHSVPGHVQSSQQLGELLVGKQLGTFRLERFLGSGGMGAVFQATDVQLHRQVAVKVLKNSDGDPDAIRRFRTEAQSAARLDHENIARVYHVGQDQGWNYIVLELVEGRTLRQLVLDSGPLSFELAINYFRQLAAALQHAHHRKIIHRDIKPSNVLITPEQRVKVVDMGLARIITTERQPDETEDGMTLGTFDYIAPEQARDPRSADEQSDLYSLGCTLFFALTGRAPFAGGNAIEKILNHSTAARPNVCDLRPELPPEANLLITRLMASNKLDRIQSADELGQALEYLAQPRMRQVERTATRPVSARVPMLMMLTATVLFLLSLLFDGPATDSQIQLPEIPGTNVQDSATNAPVAASNPVDSRPTPLVGSPPTTPALNDSIPGSFDQVFETEEAGTRPFRFQSVLNPDPVPTSVVDPIVPWLADEPGEVLADNWELKLGPTTLPNRDPEMGEGIVRGNDGTGVLREPNASNNRVPVTIIQVYPTGEDPPLDEAQKRRPNTIQVGSLKQAIDRLESLTNVHTIELCTQSVQDCPPLELKRGTLRVIKAGAGFRPKLRFTARPGQSVDSMMVVRLDELSLTGLDILVDGRSAQRSLSFLQFPKLNQLTIEDCSLTFQSKPDSGLVHQWVNANTTPVSVTLNQPPSTFRVVATSIRGGASLLSVENLAPLGVRLAHCWIATSAAVFRFQGLSTDSANCSAELDIQRSTVLAGGGLAISEATARRRHGQLVINSRRSIFASTEAAPLVRHVGPLAWKPGDVPLYFEGNQNRFAASRIWEISGQTEGSRQSYTLKQSVDQAWFQQIDYADWQSMMVDSTGKPLNLEQDGVRLDWQKLKNTVADPEAGAESIGPDAKLLPKFPSESAP